MNREITADQLRVIDADGTQIGIFSRSDALSMADSRNVDLIELAGDKSPPIVKLMEWNKFAYEQHKHDKAVKRNQKDQNVRLFKIRPVIGEHDLVTNIRKIKKLLIHHKTVRIAVQFRGREVQHPEFGFSIIERVQTDLSEMGVFYRIDAPATLKENVVSVVLSG